MRKYIIIALIVLIVQGKLVAFISVAALLALLSKIMFILKVSGIRQNITPVYVLEGLSLFTYMFFSSLFSSISWKVVGLYLAITLVWLLFITIWNNTHIVIVEDERSEEEK